MTCPLHLMNSNFSKVLSVMWHLSGRYIFSSSAEQPFNWSWGWGYGQKPDRTKPPW